MPRSVASRLVALLLALAASFAAPVSALAHGHAHHHETTGRADDDHHSAGSHVPRAEPGAAAESTDHGPGDHAHAIVSAAVIAKTPAPLVALIALRVTLPPVAVVVATPPEADITLQPRASPAHAPPPRLRAPPTVLG